MANTINSQRVKLQTPFDRRFLLCDGEKMEKEKLIERVRSELKALSDSSGQKRASEVTGMNQGDISKFIRGVKQGMNADTLLRVAYALGARIIFPDEKPTISRDVCFVDAKIVSAADGARPPQAENYIAVPLVGQAGAGPGIVPEDKVESWVLVYAHHHSVMRRSNLLAVEVGKESDSMEPLISPYDIVLVDRDDFVPQQDGRGIYLVREPGQLGGGMIKRVQVHRVKGETQVVFYSDNKKYGPEPPRFLDADYGDRWENAIVGRCVWSWSDLTRK